MTVPADSPGPPRRPPRPCPICRRPARDRYRPFCSRRCADIDLGRWLGEVYRIPAKEDEGDGGEGDGGEDEGDEGGDEGDEGGDEGDEGGDEGDEGGDERADGTVP